MVIILKKRVAKPQREVFKVFDNDKSFDRAIEVFNGLVNKG